MGNDVAALPAVFWASDRTANPACLLTDDLRMVRTNAAWQVFAHTSTDPAHLTWAPGASLLDVIPEPLREFYACGFKTALQTRTPWAHDHDWLTPDQSRTFRMIAYPQDGFLVVSHAPHVMRPHDREAHPAGAAVRGEGLRTICCHCRSFRAPGSTNRWEWVPAWIAQPPARISHGLCPTCSEYHYPREAER